MLNRAGAAGRESFRSSFRLKGQSDRRMRSNASGRLCLRRKTVRTVRKSVIRREKKTADAYPLGGIRSLWPRQSERGGRSTAKAVSKKRMLRKESDKKQGDKSL